MLATIIDILGAAGFVISVVNLTYFFIVRKKKLSLCVCTYGTKPHFDKMERLIIQYRFDNLSQLPITITRMRLLIDNTFYDSNFTPVIAEDVKVSRGNEVTYQNAATTDTLPLNLDALASRGGYLWFAVPRGTLQNGEKPLTFQICTNRGKPVQKTFSLLSDVLIR